MTKSTGNGSRTLYGLHFLLTFEGEYCIYSNLVFISASCKHIMHLPPSSPITFKSQQRRLAVIAAHQSGGLISKHFGVRHSSAKRIIHKSTTGHPVTFHDQTQNKTQRSASGTIQASVITLTVEIHDGKIRKTPNNCWFFGRIGRRKPLLS